MPIDKSTFTALLITFAAMAKRVAALMAGEITNAVAKLNTHLFSLLCVPASFPRH